MRADRQTDITKLIIVFRNFDNTPENVFIDVHVRIAFRAQKVPCKNKPGGSFSRPKTAGTYEDKD
jgi:hypothetical protein